MKCKEAQPNLTDYSRGLLNPVEMGAVRQHLDACEECRAMLESEALLFERVASAPSVAPSTDIWPKVASRVHTERRPVWLMGVDFGVYARRLVATAAVFVMLLAALFVTAPWKPHVSERDSIRQAAALMQVQPVSHPTDDQLTGTTDDMMKVIDGEL